MVILSRSCQGLGPVQFLSRLWGEGRGYPTPVTLCIGSSFPLPTRYDLREEEVVGYPNQVALLSPHPIPSAPGP